MALAEQLARRALDQRDVLGHLAEDLDTAILAPPDHHQREFGAVVVECVEGKRIDDRPLRVTRVTAKDFTECGCQILFVASDATVNFDDVIRFQRAASVLTIAETPDFTRRGGMIALTVEDSKVRFSINKDAASQASLVMSSRLLTLASVVQTGR